VGHGKCALILNRKKIGTEGSGEENFFQAVKTVIRLGGVNRLKRAGGLRKMAEELRQGVTGLLKEAQAGDRAALDELLPLVYRELKGIAARQLAGERPDHTLQATALVNEAYLRLIDQHSVDWRNRAHFFSIAAETMRRVLVNHAVNRRAEKRGAGATLLALDDVSGLPDRREVDLILLDEALTRLAEFDPVQARIVEMKFFAGLSNEEVAEVTGTSESTVKREWRSAKAWLAAQLT
jgi:RNA polymerase sigma-70 factor (ECF subfamily)